MSEQKFRKYFRDNIENMWGFKSHVSLVESPDTASGIPDCNISIEGVEAHVELKFSKEKQCFKLRPTQIAWFRRRNKSGSRNNFILWCQEINGHRLFHVIPGKKVQNLGRRSYDQDMKAVHMTWVGKIKWDEFFEYLVNIK